MPKIYTIILSLPLLSALALPAAANKPLELQLGGSMNTQAGYVRNNEPFRYDFNSGQQFNRSALVSDTKITLKANGDGYGAVIELHADASASKLGNTNPAKNTWVYVEDSKMGRLTFGSNGVPSDGMSVSASNLAGPAGGIDGDASLWINQETIDGFSNGDIFLEGPSLPVGYEVTGRSNKISYINKNNDNFEFALSFIPNAGLVGTAYRLNADPVLKYAGSGYRNVMDAIGVYYYEYNDNVGLAVSLGFQHGTAKEKNSTTRKNLNAGRVDFTFNIHDLTLAASYGDWGKSGVQAQQIAGKKYGTKFWALGAAYKIGHYNFDITHMNSKRAGGKLLHEDGYNRYKITAVGADCASIKGFNPYIQAAHIKLSRFNQIAQSSSIFLAGIKIIF